MTLLCWYWHIRIHSKTLKSAVIRWKSFFSISSKAGEKNEKTRDDFITASLIASVSLKVYNCLEQAEINGLIYLASGAGNADLWWASILEGASQPRPHFDFHKQKDLPCLLLQNRQWRAPSLKDIKEKRRNMGVRHWLCLTFTDHANFYDRW